MILKNKRCFYFGIRFIVKLDSILLLESIISEIKMIFIFLFFPYFNVTKIQNKALIV